MGYEKCLNVIYIRNVITINKNEVYLYFTYDITIKTLSSLDECIFLSCVDVISNETSFHGTWNQSLKCLELMCFNVSKGCV